MSDSPTLEKLRDRKVVQWSLAYLAGAWALLQVLDLISNRFSWPAIIVRASVALLGIGFFAALIVAWYHGEQGKQRVSGIEIIMLAAVLFVAGIAAAVVGPEPARSRTTSQQETFAVNAASPYKKYVNSKGYDGFTRGHILLASENAVDTDRAIELLEQAVSDDPDLAPAYAALARAYRNKAFFFADDSLRKRLNENAAVAVEKALTLDPNLADAHFARGLIIWTSDYRFPHGEAIAAFRRAIALNPALDEAHHQLGLVYFHIGLFDQADAEIQKAVTINPGNNLARFRFGVIAMYKNDWDSAYAIFKSTPLDRNPSLWAFQTATALLSLGRTSEAKDLLTKFLADYPKDEGGVGHSVQALMWAEAHDTARADDAIRRAAALGSGFGHFHHTAYNIAATHALLNRPDSAVKWLQAAADDGFPCYPYFAHDSNLDNVRSDPRFVALMSRLEKDWQQYRVLYGK
jgi:tetratricopeptide (TPR) repeat protein